MLGLVLLKGGIMDVVCCDSFGRILLCDRLREGACCEGGRGI